MTDLKEARRRLDEIFGSREAMLGNMLIELSTSGQPCDVTFYHREPILNVKVDQQLALTLMYGGGVKALQKKLSDIKFSDGTSTSLNEIWMVLPMPSQGFTDAELAAVDLSEGEEKIGDQGETMREMIRDIYHCKTREQEDRFLRRYIAS
jgi:hypothetical protein